MYNPVNGRDVQPAGRHVCAKQDPLQSRTVSRLELGCRGLHLRSVAELKKGLSAFCLLLVPVEIHARDVHIVEELCVELYRVAR